MKKYGEPKTGKIVTISVLVLILGAFLTSIVFGIVEMKERERRAQEAYDYINRMCEPMEYDATGKPSKYSCGGTIFNLK